MHPYYFRILLTLIALLLVGLASLIAPIEALQLPFFLISMIAAVMIVQHLPITRRQLMKAYVLIGSGMVLISILAAILLFFFEAGDNAYIYEMGMSCFIGGFILALIGGIKLRRSPEFDIQDERTKKIGAWGITYSWYLTYLFIVLLLFSDSLGIKTPNVGMLLYLLIFIMPLSAYMFQSYFYYRGDIDP